MRQYLRNIIIYLAALFAIIAFIALFANSLEIYDSINDSWVNYKVNAYLGEKTSDYVVYKGTIIPVFGFTIPLVIAIVLIVESFKQKWSANLKVLNTVFAIILFLCVLCVLLTKELFLSINFFNESELLRNGAGPTVSAIASTCGAILLLFATWLPFKSDIKFIERG